MELWAPPPLMPTAFYFGSTDPPRILKFRLRFMYPKGIGLARLLMHT